MNKEELIYTLLEKDLNQFCFSVWVRRNEVGELEYSICGTRDKVYDMHFLMYIGGIIPDVDYTYESIEYSLVDALECF